MTESCCICGHETSVFRPVLWPGLIEAWELSAEEADYIDRQQGECCGACGTNIRSQVLAKALMTCFRFSGTFNNFVTSWRVRRLRVLEINEAGMLSKRLCKMRGHRLCAYPAVDIHKLPFDGGMFDVVVHSDTLEHVAEPVRGLSECRRVLKPGGVCCYTVPVIVGRLSRNRAGLPPSRHGCEGTQDGGMLVHTEFGADFWQYPLRAGFSNCRIDTVAYPSGMAISAIA